ncbi:hypothetical protein Calow_1156 [Caldicellulosiruptor owensensis OL]|uniref:Uncharacterized protein n=1 Tax=Caldicellulosiruptor owensensis (strain ATCC 700167 / DSM 13100 / OL) TaxID=632518 RepID=E4Q1I0_CALOW|nr:DUF5665 domain-containing protein [Caldicellulosiruptor owensensis]ADQ04714.1 hypothetical protein Calow_1156 [Caldicellulosiruptor owensensis OL]
MSRDEFEEKLNDFILKLERMNFSYYIEYLKNPKKIIFINFLSGAARGFGTAFGFSILGALLLYILNAIVKYNLPVIGRYIAEILKFVKFYMH